MASESTAHAPEGENDKASSSDNIQLQRIAREILENYSLIPPDEVVPHVVSIVCHLPSLYPHICEACVSRIAHSLSKESCYYK